MPSMVQIFDELGIEYRGHGESPHVSEGWKGVKCPWCDRGRNNFGLGYNLAGGYFNCWKCGGHSPAYVLQALTGRSLKDCLLLLDDLAVPRFGPMESPLGVFRPPDHLPAGPGDIAWNHLRERFAHRPDLDVAQLVRLWGVGRTTHLGPLAHRLFYPIRLHGQDVSWGTRRLGLGGPRYRYAGPLEETVPGHTLLYGGDFARHAVVVVEGPADAWAVGPGAVALLSTNYTPSQARRLCQYATRAVCFDSEPAAQRRASRLASELEAFPGRTVRVELQTGKDPAEASRKEMKELRKRFLD